LLLNHVDPEKEMQRRRRDRDNEMHSILREIKKTTEQRGKNRNKILVDQAVIEGKLLWKKDMQRWNEEVQRTLSLNINMMNLIVGLLELREDEQDFDQAMSFVNQNQANNQMVLADQLANGLLQIGFSIKRNIVIADEKEAIDYDYIRKPSNLPVKKILRAILGFLSSLGFNVPTSNPAQSTAKSTATSKNVVAAQPQPTPSITPADFSKYFSPPSKSISDMHPNQPSYKTPKAPADAWAALDNELESYELSQLRTMSSSALPKFKPTTVAPIIIESIQPSPNVGTTTEELNSLLDQMLTELN